jgi:exopolysaccharide biosynthesis protein
MDIKPRLRVLAPLIACVLLVSCSHPAATMEPPAPSHTPAATQAATPQPTLAPTPSPTPIPTPTPTADLNAQYYSASGEIVNIDPDGLHWSYKSPTLGVSIERINTKNVKGEPLAYYVADIHTKDFSLLRSGFANMKPQGKPVQQPDVIATEYKAVYAQNGDYYLDNPQSTMIIRDGVIYRDKKQYDDYMAFVPDGTMLVFHPGEKTSSELLAMGVKDTFNLGPILVEDGKIGSLKTTHSITGRNPRSGFGMVSPGHYIGIVVDAGVHEKRGHILLDEFAQLFIDRGCVVAYNLDGGQSAAMVFMGQVITTQYTGQGFHGQRSITDILRVGTSDLVPYSGNK